MYALAVAVRQDTCYITKMSFENWRWKMNVLRIEMLGQVKETLIAQIQNASHIPEVFYADVRLELTEGIGSSAEDGMPHGAWRGFDIGLGVRVIGGDSLLASGYIGKWLGIEDFKNFGNVLTAMIHEASLLAKENARRKTFFKKTWGRFGKSLVGTELAPIPIVQKTIRGEWETDPRDVSRAEILDYLVHISGTVKTRYPTLMRVTVDAGLSLERKIFASSEGSVIDQTYAHTGGSVYLFAQSGDADPVDLYHHCGNQAGPEALFDGKNSLGMDYESFALAIGAEADNLSRAPSLKTREKPVVVVTDPDFNALLAHEILGHPAELDRALKWETGYAGRSWFFHKPGSSVIGEQIASPLVTAFADPLMRGAYGHYEFDDEGTPARRVYLLKAGVFQEFLNSRETSAILGAEPNGHYLANSVCGVPLVRMSVVAFAPGTSDPKNIIKEVENGYYIAGNRTPAISEPRHNFHISARLVYQIRNGELTQLFRDGGIMSDSRAFLMSIDAVGDDFNIFPIPNCGKGQPIQAKEVGNGGPTMRGRAYLVGKKR